ncbi:MAG: hypothetical protein PHQ04_04430 [Opitutaceae bacterium]|nr:hypothetical protein [Opitutaceae bacterium]
MKSRYLIGLNDYDRNKLSSIPRSSACDKLVIVRALNCQDEKVRGRIERFANKVAQFLRDSSTRQNSKEALTAPAEVVLITAGISAVGTAGLCLTDYRVVEKCLSETSSGLYVVELRYRLTCGGISVFQVGDARIVTDRRIWQEQVAGTGRTPHSVPTKRQRARGRAPSMVGASLDLVYRRIPHKPESVILAPRERAHFVHKIWHAIKQAKTWKQFAELLPPGEWERILSLLEEKPRPKAEFNAEALPGYSDGDYPPWLQAEVARCLPAIIHEEFSQRQISSINGPFWEIPAEIELPLLDRLRGLGYSVERKDDWFFY